MTAVSQTLHTEAMPASSSKFPTIKLVEFTHNELLRIVISDGSSVEVSFGEANFNLAKMLYLNESFNNIDLDFDFKDFRENHRLDYIGKDGTKSELTPAECLGKFLIDHIDYQQEKLALEHAKKLDRKFC
jgi:hypothetical protein